jgi:repressor LexA
MMQTRKGADDMGNSIVATRMQQRREQLGLTLDDIALEIGVARSTIQRYEKGTIEKLKLPVIEAIANVLQVDPAWLVGKSDDPGVVTANSSDNILPFPSMQSVPLIGTIACGEPILAAENNECEVDMPEHVKADFALRCKGDSMINARIYDGDIVYIRQQPTVDDGQIAAVLVDDEATLKRVHLYPDHVVLEPENPLYRPLSFWESDMEHVRILGLAVAFTSNVR